MISALFASIVFFFGTLALYFLLRLYVRKQVPSLVCAMLSLGWPVAVARELKWLPRFVTDYFIAAAFSVGLMCWLLVFTYETQQHQTIFTLVARKLRGYR